MVIIKYIVTTIQSNLNMTKMEGFDLVNYMSQVNHPNQKGHRLIADEIMEYFK